MDGKATTRRGFLSRLAAWAGGVALVPAMAGPAMAGRSRRRWGWGYPGWGYGYGRRVSSRRRRFFYGGYPYGRGFYGGGFYNRGYYGAPYAPLPRPAPYFYPRGYYGPLLKLDTPARTLDPLALLEC
jgi:hypothetical protein